MELNYDLKQVLSPKRYLSKSQQSLPRQDQRKQQLALQIRQALKTSKNYQEFEQLMTTKGYQVLKGRGISFVDDKKVKIKGSEVNYSLGIIERILAQQKMSDLRQSAGGSGITNSYSNSYQKSSTFNSDEHFSKDVSNDLSKVIDVLMKPVQTHGGPDDTATEKKLKKKRKRSHHL